MRNEARTLYSPSVQQLQHRPCQQSNQEFSHGKINSANGKIVLEDFSGLAGWHSVVCVCVFVLVLYVCMVIWSWLSYSGITAGWKRTVEKSADHSVCMLRKYEVWILWLCRLNWSQRAQKRSLVQWNNMIINPLQWLTTSRLGLISNSTACQCFQQILYNFPALDYKGPWPLLISQCICTPSWRVTWPSQSHLVDL